jgi:prophage maintenance system killer protein
MSRFLETWTHAKALGVVIEYLRSGLTRYNLRPSHMREIHRCLMAEEPSACPCNYRNNMAFIDSNPGQVLASPPEIDSLVEKVFQYINETKDYEVEIITNVHAWLVRIHPFADGNGRIIRLIMVFLALAAGYTGIALTGEIDEYFKGIRGWDDSPEEFGGIIVREMMKMFTVYEKAQERTKQFAKNGNRKKFMVVR